MHVRPHRTDGSKSSDSTHETRQAPPPYPEAAEEPPEGELAEVRVIAATPDIAQRVALILREAFPTDEPRSYPAGPDGRGTLLHLTVDTAHLAQTPSAESPWFVTSRTQARRSHTDEPG